MTPLIRQLIPLIQQVSYQYKRTTTRCVLIVFDDIRIVGESRCPDSQYDRTMGEKIAYNNALQALESHELYARKKQLQTVNP